MGLSNAERQARWRANRAAEKAELERLRKSGAKPDGKAAPSAELAKAHAEIATLREQLAARAKGEPQGHKQAPASTKADPWRKPSADAKAAKQNTLLRREVADLKAALAREPDKKENARLEAKNKELAGKLKLQAEAHEREISLAFPMMDPKVRNALAWLAHEDSQPSTKQKHDAMVAINRLWEAQEKAINFRKNRKSR